MSKKFRAPPHYQMNRNGPLAEDARLGVGDRVVVALRSDVEDRGMCPLLARQLVGTVAEVRGQESNVVAQLESGWCINPGDRVVYKERAAHAEPGGDGG